MGIARSENDEAIQNQCGTDWIATGLKPLAMTELGGMSRKTAVSAGD
jgi:hypothetical protein